MKSVQELLKTQKATPEEALEIFDGLEAVSFSFLKGRWKGFEIATGHELDGLLVPSGWYGKMIISREEVHPLLFCSGHDKELFSVNPHLLPLSIKFPPPSIIRILIKIGKPVLQTKKPKARIRQIEYRGKTTGAIVYDDKAIIDAFAKVDESTLLGVMDLKGDPAPFFFVLKRDSDSPFTLDF